MTSPDRPPPAPGAWGRAVPSQPRMTFGRAVRTCLSKYASFSGRASRPEYWWFILFLFLGESAAGIIDMAIFGEGILVLGGLFSAAAASPSLAAGWRRMHDTGRSGLYLLYPLIVMLGLATFGGFVMGFPEGRVQDAAMIVLALAGIVFAISPLLVLWWLTRPTDPNSNRYGLPPSEVTQ